MINKQKTAINLIRSIMRLSGRTQVWNNLYPMGVRTVKCYRDKDQEKDLRLQTTIHSCLNNLNIVHQIKFTEPSAGAYNPSCTGGFIVKIEAENY